MMEMEDLKVDFWTLRSFLLIEQCPAQVSPLDVATPRKFLLLEL